MAPPCKTKDFESPNKDDCLTENHKKLGLKDVKLTFMKNVIVTMRRISRRLPNNVHGDVVISISSGDTRGSYGFNRVDLCFFSFPLHFPPIRYRTAITIFVECSTT